MFNIPNLGHRPAISLPTGSGRINPDPVTGGCHWRALYLATSQPGFAPCLEPLGRIELGAIALTHCQTLGVLTPSIAAASAQVLPEAYKATAVFLTWKSIVVGAPIC